LVSLSEQNLVDCSTANEGCSGGWMDTAFAYVKSNSGLDTESSYPYTAKQGTCKFSKANVGVTVSGWTDIASGEAALQQAVATMGPISVAIDAGHPSFQNYKQGVYYESLCSSTNIDHGVLVVGYGTDPTYGDYWLVKNSWGTGWGESGYIRMARNKNNNCGVATYPSVPKVSNTAAGCTVSVNGQPEIVPSGCVFCNGQQGVVTEYVTCNAGSFIANQCGSGKKCQGNGQCSIYCG